MTITRRKILALRILVTNDDGITAPGLAHLAAALARAGFDVLVAAPQSEASGAGAGVGPLHTMRGGIDVTRFDLASTSGMQDLAGVKAIAVDALPGLIVVAGCLGAYGPPPDLVVAGINPGRNVGRAVLHSGTVGAALTAVHFDRRALAVSIQSGPFSAFESDGGGAIHFETAAAVAVELASKIAAAPPGTVVNCNVPNLPLERVRGMKWASLARSGVVRSALVGEGGCSRMQLEFGIGDDPPGEGSDESLTTEGYVAITPLASVAEESRVEVRAAVATAISDSARNLGLDPDRAAAW